MVVVVIIIIVVVVVVVVIATLLKQAEPEMCSHHASRSFASAAAAAAVVIVPRVEVSPSGVPHAQLGARPPLPRGAGVLLPRIGQGGEHGPRAGLSGPAR